MFFLLAKGKSKIGRGAEGRGGERGGGGGEAGRGDEEIKRFTMQIKIIIQVHIVAR